MPRPRLLALITALLFLTGTGGLRAQATLEQLEELERLILAKDPGALFAYVQANPGITEGSDPLAEELRNFTKCTAEGQLDCYGTHFSNHANSRDPEPVTAIY